MYVVKIIKKHKKIKMTNTNYNQKNVTKRPGHNGANGARR